MACQEYPTAERPLMGSKMASKTALSILLAGGLSWMGGFVDGDGAIAQTTPPDDAIAVPSAQDLLAPVLKAQPLPPAPAPVAPAAPIMPAPAPVSPSPIAPVPVTTTAPPVSTTVVPDGAIIEFSKDKEAPVAPPTTATTAPVLVPNLDLSDLKTDIPAVGVDYGSSYVDTTDYSIGATSSPEIVLTERSTGCKAVLQRGQAIPSSVCGGTAAPVAIAGSLNPALPNGQPVALTPQGPLPHVNAVSIGPLSIGPNGIQITRRLSVQNYYNRTERPKALGGNGNVSLRFPLSIPAMISSPFGWRSHPIFGNVRMHTGTDLAAPMGTPVVAAYSGRVAIADFMGGYGLAVVMGHSEKSAETLYGHLSEVFVKAGEWVEQGEIIGRVGSTGNSTGPHLHFELRKQTENGWAAVNAGAFLQNGLAKLHEGFQLTADFSLADAKLVDPKDGGMLKLLVPKVLQQGKDAIKDDLVADASGDISRHPDQVVDAAEDIPKHPDQEPGDWVSPKDVVSDEK